MGSRVQCFIFDWGEPAETALAAPAVVGALDQNDRRLAAVLACDGAAMPDMSEQSDVVPARRHRPLRD